MRGFASDNFAGAHPKVIEAISEANQGHVIAYGDDEYTAEAKALFQKHFGNDMSAYFVFTGTAANVLGLKAITRSIDAVICPDTAHIMTNECGAVENYTGCQLLSVSCPNGKMTPQLAERFLELQGSCHHAQPKVISISQATELGTIYTIKEVKALADFAHAYGMYLHMDGARLSHAVAAIGCTFREMTVDAGVDLLSFGGTKHGMLFGEALLFFGKLKDVPFPYIQKQGMQMASKMRFLSAQFLAMFEHDLFLKNACHSNEMAKLLEMKLRQISGLEIVYPVETNAVFIHLPLEKLHAIQEESFYWMWSEKEAVGRLMTSWDTTEEDIEKFVQIVKTKTG